MVYGKIETGNPHDLNGKNNGFRLNVPLNQSYENDQYENMEQIGIENTTVRVTFHEEKTVFKPFQPTIHCIILDMLGAQSSGHRLVGSEKISLNWGSMTAESKHFFSKKPID